MARTVLKWLPDVPFSQLWPCGPESSRTDYFCALQLRLSWQSHHGSAHSLSGERTDDLIDVVVKFADGAMAITTGTAITVPGVALPVKRGFMTLDDVAAEKAATERRELAERKESLAAEAAKKARIAKYGAVRIWHDTRVDVVRAGNTGSWFVACKDDRIDDQRTCTVSAIRSNMVSIVVGKSGALFDIGADNYPRSEVAIRIDKAPPVKWIETGHLVPSPVAISQMLGGKVYLARYYGCHTMMNTLTKVPLMD